VSLEFQDKDKWPPSLAELLSERDQFIKAGTFVLAGAATAAVALEPEMEVSLSVEGLSEMSVNIEE
jgi:2-oxo-3-hexenedioate decarboxylase